MSEFVDLEHRWQNLRGKLPPFLNVHIHNYTPILFEKYQEPHRRYHTLQHLEECFEEYDEIVKKLDNPVAVELAIWFHDIVYDPESTRNEEDSADIAASVLREYSKSTYVQQLIMSTKNHQSFDKDSSYLIDTDISIFGKDEKRFLQFEQQIREEFSMFSDRKYNLGRRAVIKDFLLPKHIYSTTHFLDKYEDKAQENLKGSSKRINAKLSNTHLPRSGDS